MLLVWSLGSGTISVPGSSGHAFSTTASPWLILTRKLIRMYLGTMVPMVTLLKALSGQTLNSGTHDGLACHLVPLPIRWNRKLFRKLIIKCCTVFATTRRFEYDALLSFIWTTSSRRSDSLMVLTQCLLQLDMPAVMKNFGRSFSSASLWIAIFHFSWGHLHSLDTVICGALIFRAYSISLGMYRVCLFPILALVWPFAIFILGRWLEIYPNTSNQFCGCDPSGMDSGPSTDCWTFTWFCMSTSLPSAINCSLEAIFQQFFSRVVDFMFLRVVLRVCREFQCLSEFQVLLDWFSSLVNRRAVRMIQTLKILPQWFQMLTSPGIEGILHHPADSGDASVWSLYATVCECGTTCWAAFFRHWFDTHVTYSRYMCSHSRKFWGLWALRSRSNLSTC